MKDVYFSKTLNLLQNSPAMPNAVIQHNFTSGLGDCVVCVSEYIQTAKNLKLLGFKHISLEIYTKNNLYYNNLNLFDLFDISSFDVFDDIKHIETPNFYLSDYKIAHLSYGAGQPGLHWWDLFVDRYCDIDNLPITTFPHTGYFFQNLPNKYLFSFSPDIINKFNNIKYSQPYACIYIRTQDLDDQQEIYEQNKDKIKKIYDSNSNVFICSNSYSIKKQLITNYQSLYLNHTLESIISNHHNFKNKIQDNIAKDKTIDTIMDMLAISNSYKVYFLTSWHRISNFLFLSVINKIPIEII